MMKGKESLERCEELSEILLKKNTSGRIGAGHGLWEDWRLSWLNRRSTKRRKRASQNQSSILPKSSIRLSLTINRIDSNQFDDSNSWKQKSLHIRVIDSMH